MKITIRLDVASAWRLIKESHDALLRYEGCDGRDIIEFEFESTGEFGLNCDRPQFWTVWR